MKGKRNCKEKSEMVRKEIESKGYSLLNEYIHKKTELSLICPSGHERKCRIASFRRYECKECLKERNLSELMTKIENKGYEVTLYPIDTRGTVKAICENGHTRTAKAYNFINHDCIECKEGRPKKYDFDFCKLKFNEKGFTLLEDKYTDCKTMMKYLCICGEPSETTLDILLNVNIEGCSKCKGKRYSAENHYNWHGGISSEMQRIRSSGKYCQWRKDVFKRDNFTCQCCKSVGGYLNAHHIENFSECENRRFDVNNGITLCERCHSLKYKGSFHDIFGAKNNTLEQLQEYIKNFKKIKISG